MCGIVYQHNLDKTPVNNEVYEQFDKQRSRGTEGFGLFDGVKGHLVRASQEAGIIKWLVKYDSNLILFHHRNPTSTINVKRAAHPFSTKEYFGKNQYVLVHNGHISNARSLKLAHEKLGITYNSVLQDGTFNDSEALLWDMALTLEGKQSGLHAQGGIAFICLKLHKGKMTNMFFGRNSNPLNLLRNKTTFALSSEGAGEAIEPDTLYNYNYKLNRLTTKYFEVPSYSYSYTYTKPYASPQTSRTWDDKEWYGYYDGLDTTCATFGAEEDEEQKLLALGAGYDEYDVIDEVNYYLQEAKGNYEQAYWSAEHDYEAVFEDQNYDMAEALLLEKVMQTLNTEAQTELL